MKRFLRPFEALRYKNFRLLWSGLFISWLGSQLQTITIIWHIYHLTNSPFSLAIIGLVRFIPLILVSPFAGILADKYNRKKLILLAQTISMAGAIILSCLTLTNHITPLFIYFALILNSIGTAIDSPARQSLIPDLIPKETLRNALGLTSTMYQATLVVGPALAGFLLASTNIGIVYSINAVCFIAIIAAAILITAPKHEIHHTTSVSFASLKEGFTFVFGHPLIASTMLLDFFATFFASSTTLLPIFAKEIFHIGPQGLGILYTAPSVGAIIAGFIFSSFKHVRHQGRILLVSVLVFGLSTVLFGLTHSFVWALLFLGISGAADAISAIIRSTIRQLSTPAVMRGRMSSVSMIFYMGGPQLGEVEAGVATGLIGLKHSVILGGVATVFLTIVTYSLVPRLRKYHGDEIVI